MSPAGGTLKEGDSIKISIALNRTNLQSGITYPNIIFSTNENTKDSIKTTVNHFVNTKWLVDFNVVDAEFCKETNKILIASTNPNRLLILDPDTRTVETVALNTTPKCISVNKSGSRVAIGHNAMITLVNLTSKTIEKEVLLSCDALDIVLSSTDWAYVFPVRDQWTNLRCVNLTTGNETIQSGYSIYAGTVGRLHPSEKWLYGADNNISPSDLEKYNIENGTATYMYDSPYHGDYPISGNLWFSEDGDRIFTKGKTVLKSSSDQKLDMVYNGTMNCTDNIKTLVHSKINDKVFFVTSPGYSWSEELPASEVQVFSYSYLNYIKKYSLESFLVPFGQNGGKLYNSGGYFVYANKAGTKLYVIVKAANGSGLLNEWAIQNFDID